MVDTMKSHNQLPVLPKSRTPTSLHLPEHMDFSDWLTVGQSLGHAEKSLMWWIGDWWAYGEQQNYGERKAVVESEDWEGPPFSTCMTAGWVARKIRTSIRIEVLGFSAHQFIAGLPEEWHEEALAWAAGGENGVIQTIAAIREHVKQIKAFLKQGWTQDQLERKAKAEAGECVVANIREGEDGRRRDEALISWAEGTDRFVRIDRKTNWGNPFEMPDDGDRDEVIRNFANYYLPHKPSLLKNIPGLKGKVLGCWCYPEPCHGDVIAEEVTKEYI